MANSTGAFGLKPIRRIDGSPWNGNIVRCYISSGYATALFVGDPVILTATLADKDVTGTKLSIKKSAGTAGTLIRGVITSFEPTDRDSKPYNPANTERIANVCMDKNTVYAVRGNGGGAPSKVFPGQNAVLIQTTAGSTTTGLSGMHLNEATTGITQNFTLHILNILNSEDNVLGDNAVYEVLLNTSENATGRFLGITAT